MNGNGIWLTVGLLLICGVGSVLTGQRCMNKVEISTTWKALLVALLGFVLFGTSGLIALSLAISTIWRLFY